MEDKDKELLIAAAKAMSYLDAMIFVAKHHIPFEEWPEELQAIAGVNEDLLGKVDEANQ